MGGASEKILDPETSSTASFEQVQPSKVTGEIKDLVLRAPGTAAENESPPDVLYVLQYLGFANKVIETRESSQPFGVIPEYGANGDAEKGKDDKPEAEKPVLEIVTRVSTQYSYGKNTRHRHRNRYPPPPPGVYDDYQYDDYGFNEQMTDSDEEPQVKIAKVERTSMTIHSQHLINALRAVVAYYPFVNLMGNSVVVDAPYRVIVHHRDALAKYKSNQPACHSSSYARTTAKHIDILLDFLERDCGAELRQEEERNKKSNPMATFDKYWTVLKPGAIVFGKRNDIWSPYILSNITQPATTDGRPTSYQVNCWFLEFNGTKLMRQMAAFTIAPWTGEQAIHSVEVIPSQFFPGDPVAMLEKQVRLGKLYWDLLKRPTYMEYDGLLAQGGQGNIQWRGPSGYMTGRVICDAEGYSRFYCLSPEYHRGSRSPPPPVGHPPPPPRDHLPHYQPRCGCRSCSSDRNREDVGLFVGFEDLDPKTSEPPKNDLFYVVCSKVIAGFLLGDRRWGYLNLEHLGPVTTDREAFKYLVLDDEIKLTVKALIGQYAADGGKVSPWANDFVKNKGEGKIFLLHGAPGVGKTCTAECVAELTQRPLLSLTSGDLSVNAYNVENNLSYFLQLGQRFGALVLLDEADVYLERRRAKDISRNGLVSVFLRALEYYRGVLFLTTNRVQAFDTAFTSRIHIALHYKQLTDNDRELIWANNFERLDRDSSGRVHVSVAAREYAYGSRDVRSLRWNGREIRNAMQTAVALAESDAVEQGSEKILVSEKHLRAVAKMSRGFKDYLRSDRVYDGESDEDEGDNEDNSEDDEEVVDYE